MALWLNKCYSLSAWIVLPQLRNLANGHLGHSDDWAAGSWFGSGLSISNKSLKEI